MHKIGPCLWFDNQAEEAATFYVSIFKNSSIIRTTRYLEGSPGPVGSVMTVEFVLDGEQFVGLNGGPVFQFTPAISFIANCEGQDEVDELWDRLSEGGQPGQCGWVTDKFGVSWQIVPTILRELLSNEDKAAATRVNSAMLKMEKLDIAALRRAFDGSGE
jgi:predicted 3-demethylubiquinone-9 3-methyltransferase (glyoxalase superfamily)